MDVKLACVEYHVESKRVLNGITALVLPGELLALMGPSGSGKTTLLKILSGRINPTGGNVKYSEHPVSMVKKRIGFVEQDDVLFPTLTVKESLDFTAMLRLSSNTPRDEKLSKSAYVLKLLGLDGCGDTRIGSISGGERKRVSIGTEILTDPALLLLDEPTSGLDSVMARKVIEVARDIAKDGITVVTTIHQPSSRLFCLFDKLLLISKGYPLYTGLTAEALPYFNSIGLTPDTLMNPAEFLLELASGDFNNQRGEIDIVIHQDVECGNKQESSVLQFLQTKYKTELEPRELQIMSEQPQRDLKKTDLNYASSWLTQFTVLLKRTIKVRSLVYFDCIKWFQMVAVSLTLGLLWWQSKPVTSSKLRDQTGLLFYIVIYTSSTALFQAVNTYPLEERFLIKELGSETYHLSAFYLNGILTDSVVELFQFTGFILITYFMSGLQRTCTSFLLTLLSTYLIATSFQGVGNLLGATFMNMRQAGTGGAALFLFFLLAGGYYVQHLPSFLKWVRYVSPIYYGYHLLVKIQYSANQNIDCKVDGPCQRLQDAEPMQNIQLHGGIGEASFLLSLLVVTRVLTYLLLSRLKKPQS